MGDDEARQHEEIVHEQIGVLDEAPVPPVAGDGHMEHDHQDGADPAQGIQGFETLVRDDLHGRVITGLQAVR